MMLEGRDVGVQGALHLTPGSCPRASLSGVCGHGVVTQPFSASSSYLKTKGVR